MRGNQKCKGVRGVRERNTECERSARCERGILSVRGV